MIKNKKQILIVGGTGFIGKNLSFLCLKNNLSVTVLSKKRPKTKIDKIKYIICDITNFHLLKKKINLNFDYVVNLGGNINHSDKKETMKAHFQGCKNLVKIFQKSKNLKFIQIGSSLEYGKQKAPHYENSIFNKQKLNSPYSKAKFLASKHLFSIKKRLAFNFTILRLYQVYGPHQKFDRLIPYVIKSCILNKKFPCSEGSQYRDFTYVDDITRAIILILSSKKTNNQIINLGYGRPIKVVEVIKLINKTINKGKPIFGKIKIRKDENLSSFPNVSKAKKIVRWKARTGLLKGLKETIRFYKKELKK